MLDQDGSGQQELLIQVCNELMKEEDFKLIFKDRLRLTEICHFLNAHEYVAIDITQVFISVVLLGQLHR